MDKSNGEVRFCVFCAKRQRTGEGLEWIENERLIRYLCQQFRWNFERLKASVPNTRLRFPVCTTCNKHASNIYYVHTKFREIRSVLINSILSIRRKVNQSQGSNHQQDGILNYPVEFDQICKVFRRKILQLRINASGQFMNVAVIPVSLSTEGTRIQPVSSQFANSANPTANAPTGTSPRKANVSTQVYPESTFTKETQTDFQPVIQNQHPSDPLLRPENNETILNVGVQTENSFESVQNKTPLNHESLASNPHPEDPIVPDENNRMDCTEPDQPQPENVSLESCESQQNNESILKALLLTATSPNFVQYDETNKLWRCSLCKNVYKSQSSLSNHIRVHGKTVQLTCEHCPHLKHTSVSHFIQHYYNKHEKPVASGKKNLTCKKCKDVKFATKFMLDRHMEAHQLDGIKNFHCDICQARFEDVVGIETHVDRVHSNWAQKVFRCREINCKSSFAFERLRDIHEEIHYPGVFIYKGSEGDNGYSAQDNLETHLGAHTETHSETHMETHIETHLDTHMETHSETQMETHIETHLETHPEIHLEAHPETHMETYLETHPETYLETHPETYLETHPETYLETPPETYLETHPETHIETHPETYPEIHLEAHPETHMETYLETHPETYLETHPETHIETHPETHPEIHLEAHPETHMETYLETHPETYLETHPETHIEAHPETYPEIHLEAHPEIHMEGQDLPKHFETHTGQDEPYCPPKLSCGEKRTDFFMTINNTSEKLYKCSICKKNFAYDLQRHLCMKKHLERKAKMTPSDGNILQKRVKKSDNTVSKVKANTSVESPISRICRLLLSPPSPQDGHLKKRVRNTKKYTCSICQKIFAGSHCLKIHMMTHDKEEETYTCHICEEEFASKTSLKCHVKTHKRWGTFDPLYGNRMAPNISWSPSLSKNTTGTQDAEGALKKTWSCTEVGPSSSNVERELRNDGTLSNLSEHLSKLHVNDRMETTLNEQTVRNTGEQVTFHMHQVNSADRKPCAGKNVTIKTKVVCEICGKRISKVSMRYHMLTHTGQKNYKCSSCTKTFYTECKLRHHMRLHNEKKNCQHLLTLD